MNRAHQAGFTLLEILVALSVFAVMAVLSYGGMNRILNHREQLAVNASELQQLQMAFAILQQDISQAVARPVRDNLGMSKPGFFSNPNDDIRLAITARSRSPLQLKPTVSRLQRIEYRLQDDKLVRDIWPGLDRAHNSEPQSQVLLEQIAAFEFEFINQQQHVFWPLPNGHQDYRPLPRAVRLTVTLTSDKQLKRLFLLSSL